MKLKFLTVFFLFYFSTLFVSIVSAPEYYCENRIYDPDKLLKMDEIKTLCLKIKNPADFMISIQRKLSDPKAQNAHTEDTRRQFSAMCSKLHLCRDGTIISLYTEDHKSRIYVGSKIKNSIPIRAREQLLYNEKSTLQGGNYSRAFHNIVDGLVNQFYHSYRNNNLKFTNYNPRSHNIYNHNQQEKINTSNNMPVVLIVTVMVVILLCLCLFMTMKQNEEESNKVPESRNNYRQREYDNEEKQEIREHMNFLTRILNDIKNTPNKTLQIDFCLMCMESFIPNKDNYNTTVRRFDCGHLFHYECVSEFNMCLMCKGCKEPVSTPQVNFNPNIPQQNYNQNNYNHTSNNNIPNFNDIQQAANQNHIQAPNQNYQQFPNQNYQQIPNQNYQQIPGQQLIYTPNQQINYNYQTNSNPNYVPYNEQNVHGAPQILNRDFKYFITEQNVVKFIENFKEIYDEEDLKQYQRENPKEIQKMQSDHGVGVSSLWGYAAAAGVGGLIGYGIGSYNNNSTNHNQNNHHYNNNNNYNNNQYNNNYNNNYENVAENDNDDYDGDAGEGDW